MSLVMSDEAFSEALSSFRERPFYMAMYSSLTGGITTNPALMLLPIDDHMVHRGDGVFEAFVAVNDALYDLTAHMERLEKSAGAIGLTLPFSRERIIELIVATSQASSAKDHIIRLYVSRGPGSFTANPYDSLGPQLYIVADKFPQYSERFFEEGASVGLSKFRSKESPFCNVKSCNYLLNALLKKEAVDAGLDYMVPLDAEGFVTESSTENIALINAKGEFLHPTVNKILAGTTVKRVMALAYENAEELGLSKIEYGDLTPKDFREAEEVMMIGSTMGVLPVSQFDSSPIPTCTENKESTRWFRLRQLLRQDRESNTAFRYPV